MNLLRRLLEYCFVEGLSIAGRMDWTGADVFHPKLIAKKLFTFLVWKILQVSMAGVPVGSVFSSHIDLWW